MPWKRKKKRENMLPARFSRIYMTTKIVSNPHACCVRRCVRWNLAEPPGKIADDDGAREGGARYQRGARADKKIFVRVSLRSCPGTWPLSPSLFRARRCFCIIYNFSGVDGPQLEQTKRAIKLPATIRRRRSYVRASLFNYYIAMYSVNCTIALARFETWPPLRL